MVAWESPVAYGNVTYVIDEIGWQPLANHNFLLLILER